MIIDKRFAGATTPDIVKPFVYSNHDAACYDDTIPLISHGYRCAHVMLSRAVVATVPVSQYSVVIDVGCGTGEEAIRAALMIPTATILAVDNSPEMLAVLQRKLSSATYSELAPRIRTFEADLTNPEWAVVLRPFVRSGQCAAVISGFVLHHFAPDILERLYADFYKLLAPNGVLANADLFDYSSKTMSALALEYGISYVEAQLARQEVRKILIALGGKPEDIQEREITHMLRDNHPLPIDDDGDTVTHCELLRRQGFAEITTLFREFQAGVLWARKP